MKRFRYLHDPLFLACCTLYVIARWVLKPHVHSPFIHNWLTDSLLIPCAMPPLLWLHQALGWRARDLPPTGREITIHLVAWTVLFEGIGPYFLHIGTSDPADIVAYFTGAVVAYLWWNRRPVALQAEVG